MSNRDEIMSISNLNTRRISCVVQSEKQQAELQRELDDLTLRLDEVGGATQVQVCFDYRQSSSFIYSVTSCLIGL